MYKIYINENELILTETSSVSGKSGKNKLIAPYSGKSKMLLSYIDMLEKTNRFESITIHYADLKKLKSDFESLFKIIKAAGGLVMNEKKEILFIFRRGFWDLPKGKMDPGEKKKQTAVREVIEETGVNNLEIGKKLITTRHVYRLSSGKRVLKKSFWYKMYAPDQDLIPQTEEDISKAKWLVLDKVMESKKPIFKNILDVVNAKKASVTKA